MLAKATLRLLRMRDSNNESVELKANACFLLSRCTSMSISLAN